MELDILETELLPSDVLKIKFYRPPNMKVLSGQWIRFTCSALVPEVGTMPQQNVVLLFSRKYLINEKIFFRSSTA